MKKILLAIITIFIIGSIVIVLQETNQDESININKAKLDELENIDEKINYFNMGYLNRYLAYKKNHPNEDIENIITYVNIGLDQPLYTNVKGSSYLKTTYILVNKYNKLPSDYVPDNLKEIKTNYSIGGMYLVEEAKNAFEELANKAKSEGYTIRAMSTYRSYAKQETLYNNYVKQNGIEATDRDTARPGHSEHQTGLSADVDNGITSYSKFETTTSFTWMQNNAYKYGFILRYPKGKESITGYVYES